MLYKETSKEEFQKLFQNPTSEYRATPFWAWNCKLEEEELLRQIDVFGEMGFGGFHMHSRSGMATPYLGEEFMHMVKVCTEKAKKKGMLSWLYDEDRFPSGAVGCLSVLFGYLKHAHAFDEKEGRAGDAEFAYSVIAHVDAHFSEHLTSRALADSLHVSQSHFCRRFKATFGITFERYLLLYRLERARALLRTEATSVTEVAYQTGFHSASYFGKVFREKYGTSPQAYQKAQSGDADKNINKY